MDFQKNRGSKTSAELLPYAGQYVAWAPDGSRILASGPDWESVHNQVRYLEVEHRLVEYEYIHPLDVRSQM